MHKRYLAMLLVIVMAVSLCPAIPVFAADSGIDMVVDHVEYGWITAEPVNNGDGSVSFSIMTAGAEPEAKDLTTAQVYDLTNEDLEGMDAIDEANVVLTRIGMEVERDGSMTFVPGVFAEVCYNADGDVIDVRRVLQSGLFFDTAEFGGDLTEIGSTVMHRGAEGTGIMTGEAGDMVASGWVLGKGSGTITLGDGNMATELFIEEYNVADDVKVYEVDNTTYMSTAKEEGLEAVPVTPHETDPESKYYGTIYDTASENRQFAIAIFDSDYTAYDEGTAEVVEIYYFADAIADVSSYVGLVPSSNRIGSDLSTADQGSPKPQSAPFLTSSEPFAVVEGKMWSVGDNEALNYLFYAVNEDGSYTLARYDTGWPPSGYMYWKADERALQELGGLDLDSRDINEVLLSHGHADQYGTSFDFWEMIVRAGGEAKVYETYEDGVGYDKYGFEDTVGALPTTEYAFRSIITDWYEMDKWLELGDGLACYPILTPGHSPGVASAVYQVTVGEGGMPDAHLTYDPETGERSITDYNEGDELFFIYMGGYGINGLQNPSKGYLRPAFISSLRYLQSVLPYLETTTGDTPDGIYNLPQHTNQFPYLEVQSMREMYNEKFDTNYSFLHFLREGADEVSNFAEKRASAMLYQAYDEKYQEMYDAAGGEVPYMEIDGIDVKIDATNADPAKLFTVEESGPYKHEGGETVIQIDADSEIVVMHGYDPYLNKGGVEEGVLTNTASEGGSAKQNFDMSKGFLFAKDGFVTDPDAWYVQVCAHVMDGYDGNVYSDTGVNAGSEFTSGPVESFHGEGWVEIIRTEAFDSKEEAEALAASLEAGEYYVVDLKQTGDINGTTFTPATDAEIEEAYKAGYAKTLPTVDYIIENYPKLDDYYGQYIEGYYAYNDFAVGDDLRDAHFYVPADSVFNQPTVFIGVPSDEEIPYNFLVKSGWKDLADEKGLYIIMMEDGGDGWSEDDIAYIDQLCSDVGKRPFFCTFESNFYAVAYGDAADILQQHSVENPKRWAAIAVIGATGMTQAEWDELAGTDSKIPGVSLADSQTPIWIATTDMDAPNIATMIDFYKHGNHSKDEPTPVDYADALYEPKEGTSEEAPTIIDDWWCANVVVDEVASVEDLESDPDYAESIYLNIMEGTYRYPGNANGALRRPGEIFSRGFEFYEEEVNGYLREWYVYEPQSAKDKIAGGEEVPLVFVFHGAGGTGNEIADRSGWAAVAEENGFIIVMPTASIEITPRSINNKVFPDMRPSWNSSGATDTRPDDVAFVEYLHGWMLDHYDIDATRVYASGQSSGGMMTWAVASQLPDLFAAVAPISAYWIDDAASESTGLVPIACYMGEAETTFRNGFTEEGGKEAIDVYTELYDTVEKWDTYTYMDDDSKAPEKSGVHGLFTKYQFNSENTNNGELVPMLLAVEVATKTHAIWPSECFDVWDNWFTHYTKDADGTLYYDGEAVSLTEDGGSAGGDTSKPSIRPGKDDDDDRPTDPSTGSDAIFEDIDGHWAESAIEYVYDEGLMNGISADEFSPDTATTRGMIVTMLYRLEGEPAVTAECPFDDVDAGDYYHDAVVWASENGIVNGISDTEYAPNANITREQLAAMMNRYAEFKGYDVSASTSLDGFADADDVSDYAVEALEWAVAEELVNGMGDNTVAPQGTATRAQVATIFQRFIENIA